MHHNHDVAAVVISDVSEIAKIKVLDDAGTLICESTAATKAAIQAELAASTQVDQSSTSTPESGILPAETAAIASNCDQITVSHMSFDLGAGSFDVYTVKLDYGLSQAGDGTKTMNTDSQNSAHAAQLGAEQQADRYYAVTVKMFDDSDVEILREDIDLGHCPAGWLKTTATGRCERALCDVNSVVALDLCTGDKVYGVDDQTAAGVTTPAYCKVVRCAIGEYIHSDLADGHEHLSATPSVARQGSQGVNLLASVRSDYTDKLGSACQKKMCNVGSFIDTTEGSGEDGTRRTNTSAPAGSSVSTGIDFASKTEADDYDDANGKKDVCLECLCDDSEWIDDQICTGDELVNRNTEDNSDNTGGKRNYNGIDGTAGGNRACSDCRCTGGAKEFCNGDDSCAGVNGCHFTSDPYNTANICQQCTCDAGQYVDTDVCNGAKGARSNGCETATCDPGYFVNTLVVDGTNQLSKTGGTDQEDAVFAVGGTSSGKKTVVQFNSDRASLGSQLTGNSNSNFPGKVLWQPTQADVVNDVGFTLSQVQSKSACVRHIANSMSFIDISAGVADGKEQLGSNDYRDGSGSRTDEAAWASAIGTCSCNTGFLVDDAVCNGSQQLELSGVAEVSKEIFPSPNYMLTTYAANSYAASGVGTSVGDVAGGDSGGEGVGSQNNQRGCTLCQCLYGEYRNQGVCNGNNKLSDISVASRCLACSCSAGEYVDIDSGKCDGQEMGNASPGNQDDICKTATCDPGFFVNTGVVDGNNMLNSKAESARGNAVYADGNDQSDLNNTAFKKTELQYWSDDGAANPSSTLGEKPKSGGGTIGKRVYDNTQTWDPTGTSVFKPADAQIYGACVRATAIKGQYVDISSGEADGTEQLSSIVYTGLAARGNEQCTCLDGFLVDGSVCDGSQQIHEAKVPESASVRTYDVSNRDERTYAAGTYAAAYGLDNEIAPINSKTGGQGLGQAQQNRRGCALCTCDPGYFRDPSKCDGGYQNYIENRPNHIDKCTLHSCDTGEFVKVDTPEALNALGAHYDSNAQASRADGQVRDNIQNVCDIARCNKGYFVNTAIVDGTQHIQTIKPDGSVILTTDVTDSFHAVSGVAQTGTKKTLFQYVSDGGNDFLDAGSPASLELSTSVTPLIDASVANKTGVPIEQLNRGCARAICSPDMRQYVDLSIATGSEQVAGSSYYGQNGCAFCKCELGEYIDTDADATTLGTTACDGAEQLDSGVASYKTQRLNTAAHGTTTGCQKISCKKGEFLVVKGADGLIHTTVDGHCSTENADASHADGAPVACTSALDDGAGFADQSGDHANHDGSTRDAYSAGADHACVVATCDSGFYVNDLIADGSEQVDLSAESDYHDYSVADIFAPGSESLTTDSSQQDQGGRKACTMAACAPGKFLDTQATSGADGKQHLDGYHQRGSASQNSACTTNIEGNGCNNDGFIFTAGPPVFPSVRTLALTADGASSQAGFTVEINVVSLPSSNANWRHTKTTANGGSFNGNNIALTLGENTITIDPVSYDRTVKIQFKSLAIEIDSFKVNSVELLAGGPGADDAYESAGGLGCTDAHCKAGWFVDSFASSGYERLDMSQHADYQAGVKADGATGARYEPFQGDATSKGTFDPEDGKSFDRRSCVLCKCSSTRQYIDTSAGQCDGTERIDSLTIGGVDGLNALIYKNGYTDDGASIPPNINDESPWVIATPQSSRGCTACTCGAGEYIDDRKCSGLAVEGDFDSRISGARSSARGAHSLNVDQLSGDAGVGDEGTIATDASAYCVVATCKRGDFIDTSVTDGTELLPAQAITNYRDVTGRTSGSDVGSVPGAISQRDEVGDETANATTALTGWVEAAVPSLGGCNRAICAAGKFVATEDGSSDGTEQIGSADYVTGGGNCEDCVCNLAAKENLLTEPGKCDGHEHLYGATVSDAMDYVDTCYSGDINAPLALGCVFVGQSGTWCPMSTYDDNTDPNIRLVADCLGVCGGVNTDCPFMYGHVYATGRQSHPTDGYYPCTSQCVRWRGKLEDGNFEEEILESLEGTAICNILKQLEPISSAFCSYNDPGGQGSSMNGVFNCNSQSTNLATGATANTVSPICPDRGNDDSD
jgi:hypothetical protein